MKETFIATFIRTAVKADFKAKDNVPILRTPIINIFGSDVASINKMSKIERGFEHGWYVLAGLFLGVVVLAGLAVFFNFQEALTNLGVLGMIGFLLIWLFSFIQLGSLIGYLRYRIKN